jgi:hypothetical protein
MKTFKDHYDIDEALTVGQRRARARLMKRLGPKIQKAKQRAAKKMANPDKLKKRAQKKARQLLAKKLTKGKDLTKMSFAEKEKLEKKLDKLSPKVATIAKKILPKVKAAEKQRLKDFKKNRAEK